MVKKYQFRLQPFHAKPSVCCFKRLTLDAENGQEQTVCQYICCKIMHKTNFTLILQQCIYGTSQVKIYINHLLHTTHQHQTTLEIHGQISINEGITTLTKLKALWQKS